MCVEIVHRTFSLDNLPNLLHSPKEINLILSMFTEKA